MLSASHMPHMPWGLSWGPLCFQKESGLRGLEGSTPGQVRHPGTPHTCALQVPHRSMLLGSPAQRQRR